MITGSAVIASTILERISFFAQRYFGGIPFQRSVRNEKESMTGALRMIVECVSARRMSHLRDCQVSYEGTGSRSIRRALIIISKLSRFKNSSSSGISFEFPLSLVKSEIIYYELLRISQLPEVIDHLLTFLCLKEKIMRGALIVLEGCDRAGKSTQLKKLAARLLKENIPNEIQAFPDRSTPVGKVIDSYLKRTEALHDKAIHLLFSANRWELEQKICETVSNGKTLLVDRYSFSGVAFSTAKKDMDMKWCWQPEIGLPKPDLVLFLSTPLVKVTGRSNFGAELYEEEGFQKEVMANFQKMVDPTWRVINGDRDVDVVHGEIFNYVKEVISNISGKPLQRFTSDDLA